MSNYQKLRDIDVSPWGEKKGKFNYLSWAHAVDQLGRMFPLATWEVHMWEGLPYVTSPLGVFVGVTVDVEGVKKTQIHPVLDHRNNTILPDNIGNSPGQLNAFAINTSIQRCLAKAIGLHGLGIGLYCGEDLIQYDEVGSGTKSQPAATSQASPADDWWLGAKDNLGVESFGQVLALEGYEKPEDVPKKSVKRIISVLQEEYRAQNAK